MSYFYLSTLLKVCTSFIHGYAEALQKCAVTCMYIDLLCTVPSGKQCHGVALGVSFLFVTGRLTDCLRVMVLHHLPNYITCILSVHSLLY